MDTVYFITKECGNGMSGPEDRRSGALYRNAHDAYDALLKDYVLYYDDIYKEKDALEDPEYYRVTIKDIDGGYDDGWHSRQAGYHKVIEIRSLFARYRGWTYYLKSEKVL